jgi:GNAT superfamily N-acetyltransferase
MNQSKLQIRALEIADEPQWRALWTGYLTYYESTLPDEVYRTTFKRLLATDDHEFHGLLAIVDGVPIGLTHYVFHRSCWSVENVCYLQDLFVDPRYRGQHYGRALIEAVYAAADAADSPDVYWQTQHFNEVGRRLYDRVGALSPFIVYQRPGSDI